MAFFRYFLYTTMIYAIFIKIILHIYSTLVPGYYTYLEVSRARTGDFGRILSPTIPGTADQCSTVTFYYHMFGEDIGSLNLYLVHNSPPYQFDNPVYNVVGNQGNKWLKGEVNITFPTDFQVIFYQLLILLHVKNFKVAFYCLWLKFPFFFLYL